MGGNKYLVIVKYAFTRYNWTYLVSHNSDVADAFEKCLADRRVEGIPYKVVVVRSDDGGNSTKESLESSVEKKKLSSIIQNCRQPRV